MIARVSLSVIIHPLDGIMATWKPTEPGPGEIGTLGEQLRRARTPRPKPQSQTPTTRRFEALERELAEHRRLLAIALVRSGRR